MKLHTFAQFIKLHSFIKVSLEKFEERNGNRNMRGVKKTGKEEQERSTVGLHFAIRIYNLWLSLQTT